MPDSAAAIIGIGICALLLLIRIGKYWSDSNSNDLGTMSEKWLAEHNASHL